MSEEKRGPTGESRPITRHPLFPAIVALWAGALFGLASLALRPAMVEHAVLASGMARVIPMAAPPLGTTARILITLAMTGLGAMIGALIALRIARAAAGAKAEPPAPIATASRAQVRRRSITAQADVPAVRPTDAVVARAQASILNVADFEVDSFDADEAKDSATGRVPVEPGASGYEAPLFLRSSVEPGPVPGFDSASSTAAVELAGTPDDVVAGTANPALTREAFGKAEAPVPAAGSTAAKRIAAAELDDLSPIELLERLALTMARRREEIRRDGASVPMVGNQSSPEPESAPDASADGVPAALPPVTLPTPTEPDLVAASRQAMPRLPAALRPVGIAASGEEDVDDALPAYIPPRHIGLKTSPIEEEGDDAESGVLEEGYSSLLGLSRGPRAAAPGDGIAGPGIADQEIAAGDDTRNRDAEPAARPFDAPGNNDPEKTEEALREALATLQRMSGAA